MGLALRGRLPSLEPIADHSETWCKSLVSGRNFLQNMHSNP
jgi:hypothetical protein